MEQYILLLQENIEGRYSVVGVLENLNTSLAVMEQYIPGKKKLCLLREAAKKFFFWSDH